MDIHRLLVRAERLHGSRAALVQGERSLTYAETAARVRGLAAWMQSVGVAPGDRVAVLGHNTLHFFEAYFAIAACGAVAVLLNVRLTPRELAFSLRDADARLLLADAELADLAAQVRAEETPVTRTLHFGEESDTAVSTTRAGFQPVAVDPASAAHIYYTSGTTGVPKGVVLTHRNVCTHALAAIAELRIDDAEVWGHFAPLFHLADAWATFAVTWAGGRHVFLPKFDAAAALATIAQQRVTLTNLVPTMLGRMIHDPGVASVDLSSLRTVLSGGAPIAPELVERIGRVFGCEYVQTYGMTETSPYLTLSLPPPSVRELPAAEQLRHRSRTGRPFATVELEVVDDAGQCVADDDRAVGEIRVRGETVSPGYWNRPDETAAAFRDGWLYTGDLATIDSTGSVNIVDRRKDMIVTGGEKVYSTEVEFRLYEHPDVLEAAVFGVPDGDWGEVVCAAVAPQHGRVLDGPEVRAFCRARLAAFKTPRHVHVVAELPRTGSGKIDKRALRSRFGGAGPASL